MDNTQSIKTGQSVPFFMEGILNHLPVPPMNRSGWPWTNETKPLAFATANGQPWPKISIVTPSFNQGQFLEETIRSVLLQNYPNLEYIIMDGGSTDNSVEIIKKYEPWLTYWASKKDNGQADAINRGFEIATGAIISWLNSDDIYMPESLNNVATQFTEHLTEEMLVGERLHIDVNSYVISRQFVSDQKITHFQALYFGRNPFYQEAVFFTKSLWDKNRPLSIEYNYFFDLDFFMRCLRSSKASPLPGIILGCWRMHEDQKCDTQRSKEMRTEYNRLLKKHIPLILEPLLPLLRRIGRKLNEKLDGKYIYPLKISINDFITSFTNY